MGTMQTICLMDMYFSPSTETIWNEWRVGMFVCAGQVEPLCRRWAAGLKEEECERRREERL